MRHICHSSLYIHRGKIMIGVNGLGRRKIEFAQVLQLWKLKQVHLKRTKQRKTTRITFYFQPISLSSVRSVISDNTEKPLRETLTRRGQEKTNVKHETFALEISLLGGRAFWWVCYDLAFGDFHWSKVWAARESSSGKFQRLPIYSGYGEVAAGPLAEKIHPSLPLKPSTFTVSYCLHLPSQIWGIFSRSSFLSSPFSKIVLEALTNHAILCYFLENRLC